jgi:2-(1,2-epoxy-1,2-dihydrophenyl)acetyl-CoA isomerase
MNESTAALIRTNRNGSVLNVELDSPENGNAMTVAMTLQLAQTIEAAGADASIHCVVLRSTGKHFCTGGNVKDMQAGADLMQGSVAEVESRLRSTLHRLTQAIRALEIPVIASVNGAAIGAGCDLALMCDVRIASERAQFAESFLRLGLISGIGGAWFLTRLVGPAKAMEMTLTSEFIGAEDALTHGLVSRVVSTDALRSETDRLATRIAAAPPTALRMAKRLVRESADSSLPGALQMAAAMQAILLCGAEHRQAVESFLASRRIST